MSETHSNSEACARTSGLSGACGRCLFQNDCARIRLLGLPGGCDVTHRFAGCRGILTVVHGSLIADCDGRTRKLAEGESWLLPDAQAFRLWTEHGADVVFFENIARAA